MDTPDSVGSICTKWWKVTLDKDDGPARQTRARLRRCSNPIDALLIKSVHDLGHWLNLAGYNNGLNADVLALVAIGISQVQEHNDKSRKLAEIFGHQVDKDSPRILSEQRFQTLVRTIDQRELIAPLRRGLALVRHQPINVAALASDLFYWNEQTRIAWCFQYFDASAMSESDYKENNL